MFAADAPAAAAGTPADPQVPDPPGDMPVPAHGAPPRRVTDPSCRLRPGNHTLVRLEGDSRAERVPCVPRQGEAEGHTVSCAPPARSPSAGLASAVVATTRWVHIGPHHPERLCEAQPTAALALIPEAIILE